MAHLLMLHGHPVGYLPPTMASEILYDSNDTVKETLDDLSIKNPTIHNTTYIDTTNFIEITMPKSGYVTIFTMVSGGGNSIDIAYNTGGTIFCRLGTDNGAYQFTSLYVPKGNTVYIKASAVDIGGYFLTYPD